MHEILSVFFPEGLLDFFEVAAYELINDQHVFELRERNTPPEDYKKEELESKGFFQGGDITDFPLRGKRCIYKIYRRKWRVKETSKIIQRDWRIVAKGTRMTEEFAAFLKELNR